MTPSISLVAASSKAEVPNLLNGAIVGLAAKAIASRGAFSMALSGGSLASFLSTMESAFASASVDPHFDSWHIILADERCVPKDHEDSNLGLLDKVLFSKIPIPSNQIIGIDEDEMKVSSAAVAQDYETKVKAVLDKTGGQLDLAVLGFGPDGHTCSLFPGHPMLQETSKWVSSLDDSPKPPPSRISLTFPVLNQQTRHIIFCGAGGSKSPILKAVFDTVKEEESLENGNKYSVTMQAPPPFPCAMVAPNSAQTENSVTWVVDADAMKDVPISS